MPIGTGAAIGIGVGLSALNTLGGLAESKNKYKYWKKSFNYQHDANISDWNLENEYNLPVNQVQRYLQAGINPAYAFGSGMAQGGQISPSQGQQFDLPNLGEKAAQGFMQGMQISQMKSQTENIDADTRLKDAQAQRQEIDNNLQNLYGAPWMRSQIGLNEANIKNIISTLRPRILEALSTSNNNDAKATEILDLLPRLIAESASRETLNYASAFNQRALGGAIPTQLAQGQQKANAETQQAQAATEQAHASTSQAKTAAKRVEYENQQFYAKLEVDKAQAKAALMNAAAYSKNVDGTLELTRKLNEHIAGMYDSVAKLNDATRDGTDIMNRINGVQANLVEFYYQQGWPQSKTYLELQKLYRETNKVNEEIRSLIFNRELDKARLRMDLQNLNNQYIQNIGNQMNAAFGQAPVPIMFNGKEAVDALNNIPMAPEPKLTAPDMPNFWMP